MIAQPAQRELAMTLGDAVQFDQPMSRHTSLGVGGIADAVATPNNLAELVSLMKICAEHSLPYTVIGAGFNTLVMDGGIEGVVVRTSKLRRLTEEPGQNAILAEAGVSHNSLTKLCCERGLAGLEFGAGIPGTVGGWVAMNAGIGTREIEAAVIEIDILEPGGIARCLSRDELIRAMVEHPILIERPIVLANGKAALGRPPEHVLDIL